MFCVWLERMLHEWIREKISDKSTVYLGLQMYSLEEREREAWCCLNEHHGVISIWVTLITTLLLAVCRNLFPWQTSETRRVSFESRATLFPLLRQEDAYYVSGSSSSSLFIFILLGDHEFTREHLLLLLLLSLQLLVFACFSLPKVIQPRKKEEDALSFFILLILKENHIMYM